MKNRPGPLPLLNLLITIGLPAITLIAMLAVALTNTMTPALQWTGRMALGCFALWSLAVVGLSLFNQIELPESFWQGARGRFNEPEINAARSVSPILFVFALIPVFWTLFDQTNSTWVLQGEKMNHFTLLGFDVGPEEMQSANPALVMILVPLMTLVLYPRMGRFASPLRRMSYGMLLAGFSYVVVAGLQTRLDAGAQISVLWQLLPYTILTIAEVLVSTTGLEFAFREAAPEMKSLVMSFWLLTVTFGNLLVTVFTKVFQSAGEGAHAEAVTSGRFLQYAGMTFVIAVLFSIVAARYRYRDASAAQGR